MRSWIMISDGRKARARRLGQQIKQKRENRGWTQGELGERVDRDVRTIRRWEAGTSLPNNDDQEKLRDVLGLSPEELDGNVLSVPKNSCNQDYSEDAAEEIPEMQESRIQVEHVDSDPAPQEEKLTSARPNHLQL